MADSIAPINLTGQWLDIYAETGIAVGTPLYLQIIGGAARLVVQGSEPTSEIGAIFSNDEFVQVDGAQSGLWAAAEGGEAQLLIQTRSGIRRMPFSDPRVIDGNKAVTVQPFTELNSKTGRQWQAAFFQAAIGTSNPGNTVDLIFINGAERVLIKDILAQFNSKRLSYQLFKTPSYSGGTPIDYYNLNDEDAVAADFSILGSASVTSPGTAKGPRVRGIGTQDVGNRPISVLAPASGVERVLSANATYLFRFINEDTANTMDLSALATWYQGPISVELP